MNNKKDITKKAIAIGTTFSVVAGIGVVVCNDGQETQAKSVASKSIKNSRTSNSSKRPNSNAKESSPNITDSSEEADTETPTQTSSGRRSSGRAPSSSSGRRKSQVKVVGGSNTETSEGETDSKRPTASKYKSVEEKKQQSKSRVQSSRGTSTPNDDKNKIVITVATK